MGKEAWGGGGAGGGGDTESPLVLIWCVFPLKSPASLSEFCSFSKQMILRLSHTETRSRDSVPFRT